MLESTRGTRETSGSYNSVTAGGALPYGNTNGDAPAYREFYPRRVRAGGCAQAQICDEYRSDPSRSCGGYQESRGHSCELADDRSIVGDRSIRLAMRRAARVFGAALPEYL